MELAKGLEVKSEGKQVVLSYSHEQEGLGSLMVAAKVDILTIMKKAAADTTNKIDDAAVDMIAKLLE